jgi:hypothetical protein
MAARGSNIPTQIGVVQPVVGVIHNPSDEVLWGASLAWCMVVSEMASRQPSSVCRRGQKVCAVDLRAVLVHHAVGCLKMGATRGFPCYRYRGAIIALVGEKPTIAIVVLLPLA